MANASFGQNRLHDIAFCGLRAVLGTIFIAHSISKFEPGFSGFLGSIGMPPEAQIPIALLETVGGIVLIFGVLSRISASMLAMNMIGAIFVVKGAASLTGERGYELDLILLAACLVVIVAGPGKVSVSHIVKKIPRFLH